MESVAGLADHQVKAKLARIHMNGRVYDPGIGRFISADPTIASPFSSQGYNRYAYVQNNPLHATDPSGFVICIPGTTPTEQDGGGGSGCGGGPIPGMPGAPSTGDPSGGLPGSPTGCQVCLDDSSSSDSGSSSDSSSDSTLDLGGISVNATRDSSSSLFSGWFGGGGGFGDLTLGFDPTSWQSMLWSWAGATGLGSNSGGNSSATNSSAKNGTHQSSKPPTPSNTYADAFIEEASSHLSLSVDANAAWGVGVDVNLNASTQGVTLGAALTVGLGLDVSGSLSTSTFSSSGNANLYGGTQFSLGDGLGVQGAGGFGSDGPYANFGASYNAGASIQSTVGATSTTMSWTTVGIIISTVFSGPFP